MDNKQTASSGIGLGGLIFIVFLVMKLAEIGQVANWSWWWVTSPLWIPVALILGIFGVVLIFWLLGTLLGNK
jgi:small Trp-rich protein